jgi:glycerophosphoryl diester phosphodiesterase
MLLLAHRGARTSQLPENTLESFDLSLAHGCDGFEFDVRRSSDSEAVICHDPVARGLRVERTPARQLNLPTLDQVLQQFSSRAFLDIELKVPGLEEQVLKSLQRQPVLRGFVVSSFLSPVLKALHALDPTVPLGFLWDLKNQLPPPNLKFAWMIPHLKLVNKRLIVQAHAAGTKVMVWTVNRDHDMRHLAELGVDALISDDTKLLVNTLAGNWNCQTD